MAPRAFPTSDTTPFEIEIRCGRGSVWVSQIEPLGSHFRLARFRPATDLRPVTERAQTMSPTPFTPLPPSSGGRRVRQVKFEELTVYGFVCPGCRDNLFFQCLQCGHISCQIQLDSHGLIPCGWCGTLGKLNPNSVGIDIHVRTAAAVALPRAGKTPQLDERSNLRLPPGRRPS